NTVILSGGTLIGPGVIAGNLYNDAAVDARSGLVVLGNYTQTGGGFLEIFLDGVPGRLPAPLTVEGRASLAGTLDVRFAPGAVASAGERFVLLTAAGVSGHFGNVTIASPPAGAALTVDPESSEVTLVGVRPMPNSGATRAAVVEPSKS